MSFAEVASTYAFIVGIERYAERDYAVRGPCANAVAVARWLLEIEPHAGGNIHLFLDPYDPPGCLGDPPSGIEDLLAAGVRFRGSATWSDIGSFWKKELTAGSPPGSRILVFWSGHGGTGPEQRRLLFCSDYEEATGDRFFDVTNFLEQLKTGPFGCFADQVVLVDACSVYLNRPAAVAPDPTPKYATHQLAYFASPEGAYAQGEEGRGVFTDAALSVLRRVGGWPVHREFARELEVALDALEPGGMRGFRVEGYHAERRYLERVVGAIPPSGDQLVVSVKALLGRLGVTSRVLIPHYQRTVAIRGNRGLGSAQGLEGMVRELASLGDTDGNDLVPYGLLQFLKRLATEDELSNDIEAWLHDNASWQASDLKEIEEEIALEAARKILMVVVDTGDDPRGEIAGFEAHVCHNDGSFVPGRNSARIKVRDWENFEACMQEVLQEFTMGGELNNIEIHFVTEPPLFDRPFHRIPVPNGGGEIGEQAVVVLRHRLRVLKRDSRVRQRWLYYVKKLRSKPLREVEWLPIAAANGDIPDGYGLCFVGFELSGREEKNAVTRLLRLGAPCVYLSNGTPPDGDWKGVLGNLAVLTLDLPEVDAIAEAFHDARTRGKKFACEAGIVWDDPEINPFTRTEGPRIA